MKFTLTDAATLELKSVLEQRRDPNRFFRVYIRSYSWGGPLFDVGLDDQREEDYAEEFLDSKILIDQSYIEKFGGFNIDFSKNFFSKGFVVRPLKYGSKC